jgi:hypothetical protein
MAWLEWVFLGTGAIAVLFGLSLAAYILWALPARRINRLLAVFVAAESIFVGIIAMIAGGSVLSFDMPLDVLVSIAILPMVLLPWLLLQIIAVSIDGPLVAPLRRPLARALLWIVGGGLTLAVFLQDVFEYEYTIIDLDAYLYFIGLVSLYALTAAIVAFLEAPKESFARRRAQAFVVAFSVHDLLWFSILSGGQLATILEWQPGFFLMGFLPTASILFVGLLVVSLVRFQLFENDVALRLGVARGTVGVLFLGAVFIAISIADRYLEERFNWIAGGLAAGMMLLALHPLQRLAERFSNVAVPDARHVKDLRHDERRELYVEQMRIAWEDGSLSVKERRILESARQRLGISGEEAARLESEHLEAKAGSAKPRRARLARGGPA